MIYLGADKGWVRMELVPTALGNQVLPEGLDFVPYPGELGKRVFDLKVEYAVRQIQKMVAEGK